MISLYCMLLPIILIAIIYSYMTRKFSHWKTRKIPFLEPVPIFGNIKDICLWRTQIGEFCKSVYDNTKLPFIGFFISDEPSLMVNDSDLIKNISIKDFDHFLNRTMTNNEKHDGIGSNILFSMKTPKWSDVRRKMTPAFSTGKMKLMSQLMINCAEQMTEYIREKITEDEKIEARELCAKFATDTITSTSFGLEAGCFKDDNSPFRVVARRIYNWKMIWHAIQTTCFFLAPKLVPLFGMRFIDELSSNFFRDVFWRTIKERERNKVIRNDLMDILIEMKKQDQIADVESLDGDVLVAQATQFFIAGFESTSSTMSFSLMELARNPDVQEKLRDEIISAKSKYGKFCYESSQEMEYSERSIYETLRKYPILPFLDRRCSKRYQIPGSDLILEEGDMVYIPIMGIQYDPEYFPDPYRFDPDRFKKENCERRHSMTFLPFGEGPRNCIGRRYALSNAKCGLAHILSNFVVEQCDGDEERKDVRFNTKGILLQPEHDYFRFEMISLYCMLLSVILIAIIYSYMTRKFSHWKTRKVPFLEPVPIFGNIKDICLWRTTIGEFCKSVYDNTKLPFIGFFILDEPSLMVNNSDLIKNISIKDFDHFLNRTMTNNEKHDGIGSNILFSMKTPKWRDVRRRMTPAFSSGKMKLMSQLMINCAEQMTEYIRKKITKDEKIEARELCAKFTTDTITSTSFGSEAECFKDDNSPFRVIARRIYNWKMVWHAIQTTCFFLAPKLVPLFGMRFIDELSSNFFRDVFLRTMKERESNKVVRNDLLDILIEMKKQDQIDDVESLDGDVLVAQATQFFIAGFETTSSTMSFSLMELARNPDVQEKLRDEIISAKSKYGKFCYESSQEMEYSERSIYETLRKYPIVPFLDRRCSKRYQIPGSDLILEEGDMVYIPIMGIQYDPEYFPDPYRFDPDRFKKENCERRHSMTFLPFGDGPRNCIGRRFALSNAKCGLAHILSNFVVEQCDGDEERKDVKFNTKGFLLQPEHGIILKFSEV